MEGALSSRGRRFGRRVRCCGLTIVAVSTIGAVSMIGPSAGAAAKPKVPGAPTIASVKAEKRGIRVAFKPPASDGGAVISSYRAKCVSSNGGATGKRSGPKSPIKVFGLSPAKKYTCTVAARNKVGGGPASVPSKVVVPLG